MAKRVPEPTDHQFEIALMWLQANEGDNGESAACHAVADWIERYRTKKSLKEVAREAGVSVARLKKHLAGKETIEPEMEN